MLLISNYKLQIKNEVRSGEVDRDEAWLVHDADITSSAEVKQSLLFNKQ